MTRPTDHPRKALGRGLSALFPERSAPRTEPSPLPSGNAVISLAIDAISPNPLQPRTVFEPERLAELAQSIRSNGVLQPLIVRKKDDRFELVAGERRWRAAKLASLTHVPVLVQDFADDRLLEVTLIENIQREDLNPVELAQAFDRMSREFHLSHEDIGQRTGKDRTTITNLLRLLKLPDDVQILIAERRISPGHARAIVGLPTPSLQREAAERVVAQGLSVRQVERLVQRMSEPREPKSPEQLDDDPNVKAAVQELERVLGTRVRIVPRSEQRGRIEIDYYSQDDLDRIYGLIAGNDKD
ncbi:MAG: ParB/RepB/Spo0J family partition protein [Bryobacteraceae bacterium]|nr:ParB/RepB/Spo0J family partition protein [Bryobacteraceae bacterium]